MSAPEVQLDPELAAELEKDRTIDPGQLDVEATRQADVFYKWAERSIHAKAEADRLEFNLEVKEARLQLRCRAEPSFVGLESTTEAAIKSAVRAHQEYVDLARAEKAHAGSAYHPARSGIFRRPVGPPGSGGGMEGGPAQTGSRRKPATSSRGSYTGSEGTMTYTTFITIGLAGVVLWIWLYIAARLVGKGLYRSLKDFFDRKDRHE